MFFANSFASQSPSAKAINPEIKIVITIVSKSEDVIVGKISLIAAAAPVLVLPIE